MSNLFTVYVDSVYVGSFRNDLDAHLLCSYLNILKDSGNLVGRIHIKKEDD